MNLREAFNGLTEAAKTETVQACVSLAQVQGHESISFGYMRQIMLGLRKSPPSDKVARIISAYFIGYRGIQITPADVLAVNGGPIESATATDAAG